MWGPLTLSCRLGGEKIEIPPGESKHQGSESGDRQPRNAAMAAATNITQSVVDEASRWDYCSGDSRATASALKDSIPDTPAGTPVLMIEH